ncbi:MAG: Rossmann-like domain-containing protein [Candidatus Hodarchaeales archaeon]
MVGGMEIVDSEATLRVLQEGGGTKLFKQYGKKYNLIKE